MTTLSQIIIFSSIGSVFSLIGGLLLVAHKGLAQKASGFLAAFAAGTLLGASFFDVLPEAIEEAGAQVLPWTLTGMLVFFALERFVHWFHHHGLHEGHEGHGEPTVALVVLGDILHNFIDGVVIASAFLADTQLGIVTALAVAAHEIPQEIGDFGILLYKGMARRKVILVNFLSALVTILAAVLTYNLQQQLEGTLPYMLALVGGFFIYIAASDLIPGIHNQKKQNAALGESLLMLVGVLVVWAAVKLLGV